jgi:hypothetical protein
MRVMGLVVLASAMTLGGCATVAHGTSQAVPITSSPQGARVFVDSVSVGVTPLVATVSRRQSHVVSIVHDSFPPVRVVMDRNVSPWLLASVFFYVAPAIVDLSNGAAYGFPRDTLRVVLSAGQGAEPHPSRIPTESVATAAVLLTQLTAAYVEDAPRIAEITIRVVREVRGGQRGLRLAHRTSLRRQPRQRVAQPGEIARARALQRDACGDALDVDARL